MNKTLLQSIRDSYANKAGLSYSLNLVELPKTGYMVSLYGRERRVVPECRLELELVCQEYIKRRAVDLSAPENFFGVWYSHPEFVLDVSVHFYDLQAALDFGRANQQEAIWDIAAGEAILL